MKTARFAQVVSKCGRPVVHDQWLTPEKDATLKKAVKDNRLMTVHIHTVGSQKDHGETGLTKGGQRVLLIFPKTLRAFDGRRIVGIDYGLLKEEPQAARQKAKAHAKKEKDAPAAPALKARDSGAVLRLFRPEDEEEPPTKPKAKPEKHRRTTGKSSKSSRKQDQKRPHAKHTTRPTKQTSHTPVTTAEVRTLRTQIQKALKQLKTGKAVMAYETLEQALE